MEPYEQWKEGGRRLMSVRATIKDETHLQMHQEDAPRYELLQEFLGIPPKERRWYGTARINRGNELGLVNLNTWEKSTKIKQWITKLGNNTQRVDIRYKSFRGLSSIGFFSQHAFLPKRRTEDETELCPTFIDFLGYLAHCSGISMCAQGGNV